MVKSEARDHFFSYETSFWKGMVKLYSVHLLGHLFWQFLEGDGKIVLSTPIRAPFGQFIEEHGKSLLNMVIRALFGHFLEGHRKS